MVTSWQQWVSQESLVSRLSHLEFLTFGQGFFAHFRIAATRPNTFQAAGSYGVQTNPARRPSDRKVRSLQYTSSLVGATISQCPTHRVHLPCLTNRGFARVFCATLVGTVHLVRTTDTWCLGGGTPKKQSNDQCIPEVLVHGESVAQVAFGVFGDNRTN